jgi:hypothetical protein
MTLCKGIHHTFHFLKINVIAQLHVAVIRNISASARKETPPIRGTAPNNQPRMTGRRCGYGIVREVKEVRSGLCTACAGLCGSRVMSKSYRNFLKLLEQWPLDPSKTGRYCSFSCC